MVIEGIVAPHHTVVNHHNENGHIGHIETRDSSGLIAVSIDHNTVITEVIVVIEGEVIDHLTGEITILTQT